MASVQDLVNKFEVMWNGRGWRVGLGSLFMSSGSYLGYSAKPGFYLHDLGVNYKVGEHSLITIQYQQAPPGRYSPYGLSGYGFANDQVLPVIR